ncbi:uncharacterized protein LOC111384684 [Olea europaea var. sylvestris]|uniref:uncharacterized protein LOC111384684 n=1 Tax=Olea europaea var. sylvestris TaxID=158386 RepID=UPI000C1CFF73|nr:uncharacterized protein LOC111384684 [Olea europaea var. sylvestris]
MSSEDFPPNLVNPSIPVNPPESNQISANPSDDSSSPYYLHPSDNPGALLISKFFNGENYVVWSRSILIALTVKNKVQFIDGAIISPSADQPIKYTAWLRANNLVLSWLMNSISKEIRNSLLFVTSAAEFWNELKIRYLRSNGPRFFHLEKSLSCINQGALSMIEYFSTFKTLWDEYISYRPFPTCTCGVMATCSCELFNYLQVRQQFDYVLKFLVGLNDSYASIRSQLLLMVPLPRMSKVFSLLLQEESLRQLTNTDSHNETHALMAKQFSQQNHLPRFFKDKAKKSASQCTYCGYNGHTVEKCFQLHGYPLGWNGPKGKRNIASAHAVTTTPEAHKHESTEQPKIYFTPEEFNKIMALANSSQPNSSSQNNVQPTVNHVISSHFSCKMQSSLKPTLSSCNSTVSNPNSNLYWILDTGATDHMICSPHLYHSTPKQINASINLLNGTTVSATHIGTVHLTDSIFLHNVLCVPHFSFNLLSISKLTKQSNLSLTFTASCCLL